MYIANAPLKIFSLSALPLLTARPKTRHPRTARTVTAATLVSCSHPQRTNCASPSRFCNCEILCESNVCGARVAVSCEEIYHFPPISRFCGIFHYCFTHITFSVILRKFDSIFTCFSPIYSLFWFYFILKQVLYLHLNNEGRS